MCIRDSIWDVNRGFIWTQFYGLFWFTDDIIRRWWFSVCFGYYHHRLAWTFSWNCKLFIIYKCSMVNVVYLTMTSPPTAPLLPLLNRPSSEATVGFSWLYYDFYTFHQEFWGNLDKWSSTDCLYCKESTVSLFIHILTCGHGIHKLFPRTPPLVPKKFEHRVEKNATVKS